MNKSFKLIVISSDRVEDREVENVVELFENRLRSFHLRKPSFKDNDLASYIDKIPTEFHKYIVLHSGFDLMDKYELKGIHLNSNDKSEYVKFSKWKTVSAAFHSVEELKGNKNSYEYVLLSPIFDSISKLGYKSTFDLSTLKQKLETNTFSNANLIALGGVASNNIQKVKQMGFSGAALCGSIWLSDNPITSFNEIKNLIED